MTPRWGRPNECDRYFSLPQGFIEEERDGGCSRRPHIATSSQFCRRCAASGSPSTRASACILQECGRLAKQRARRGFRHAASTTVALRARGAAWQTQRHLVVETSARRANVDDMVSYQTFGGANYFALRLANLCDTSSRFCVFVAPAAHSISQRDSCAVRASLVVVHY
jgi:hypothetical protein